MILAPKIGSLILKKWVIIHGEGLEVGAQVEVMVDITIVTEAQVITVLGVIIIIVANITKVEVVVTVTEVNQEEEVIVIDLFQRAALLYHQDMKVRTKVQQMH